MTLIHSFIVGLGSGNALFALKAAVLSSKQTLAFDRNR